MKTESTRQLEKSIEDLLQILDEGATPSDIKDKFWDVFTSEELQNEEYIVTAESYAEPGYDLDDETMPVLLANWNKKQRWNQDTNSWDIQSNVMPLLCDLAEKMGCSIEWCDEWVVCDCNKAFRISGDSYSWTMYGIIDDDGYACGDCIHDDPADYLESLEGNPHRAITISGIDPEDYGYARINEQYFERGFHAGQSSDPQAIFDTLTNAGCGDTLVFQINSTGQFDVRFSAYVKEDNLDAAKEALDAGRTDSEVSPAVMLERGLKEASKGMAKLDSADGIKHATIHDDGTADVRVVSAQEFVEGIKR